MANKKVKFELTAVDKTKAAFDKVTKGLTTVGGAAAKAAKGVAGVGLAAGATAGALALLVDKSFQAVDAIGKTATQSGIATDTLQAFHLAARESGTTIEGANAALIKFARSVGDAQRGLKTQADIFKDLDVNIHNADGSMRSFDEILFDTAVGITNLGDQTARATALANLFGRQGIFLTGAITNLSEVGMKNFIQRAKDLGIVLSERVIRRTEAFNDAVGVVKMQLGSFINNITTSFLPVFESLQTVIAEAIQEMIDSAGGMDKLGMNIANSIIDASASVIESVGQMQFAIADFVINLEQTFPRATISFGKFVVDFLDKSVLLGGAATDVAGILLDLKQAEIDLAKAERNVASKEFLNRTKKAADNLRGMKMTAEDLLDTNKELTKSNKENTESLTDQLNPLQRLISEYSSLQEQLEKGIVASMKKFEDAIVEGVKNGKLAFKDFADFVIEEMLRIAIRRAIIAPIATALDAFMMAAFAGTTGGGGGTSGNYPSGVSFDGGGYTGMGARSGGLDGKGGFPALLHPNETVIDHNKNQAMGTTVNFNINTVDANGFDDLLVERKNLLVGLVSQAMNQKGNAGLI